MLFGLSNFFTYVNLAICTEFLVVGDVENLKVLLAIFMGKVQIPDHGQNSFILVPTINVLSFIQTSPSVRADLAQTTHLCSKKARLIYMANKIYCMSFFTQLL